jgi:hypothetical protein
MAIATAQNKGYQILNEPKGERIDPIGTYLSVATPEGSSLRLDSSFAIDCWVFIDSITGLDHKIVSTHGTGGGGFEFIVEEGILQLNIYTEGGNSLFSSINNGATVPLNRWTHVAVSLRFTGRRNTMPERNFYIDGVLTGTPQNVKLREEVRYANENSIMKIGADGLYNISSDFKIDNLRIWGEDRTLELPAIKDSCLTGSQAGLLAAYDFENADENGIADISGNGNAADFYNFKAENIVPGGISCAPETNGISKETKLQFSVYPNPTTGYITLNTLDKILEVEVISFNGQTLKTVNPTSSKIDVSELNNGVYMLRIRTQDGIGYSKFIKQ